MRPSAQQRLALGLLLLTACCAAPPTHDATKETEAPRVDYEFEAKGAAVWRWSASQTNGALADGAYKQALEQRKQNLEHWDTLDDGGINPLMWVDRGPDNIGGRCRSLLIHPTITSRWFAGSVGGGIWRSEDSGASWNPVGDDMPNLAISCMTFDPANPNIIYAGTGESVGNIDAIRGNGIWRSVNGGFSWAQLPSTDNANFDYVARIAVSPTNSSNILAATRRGIFRSTDTGASWAQESGLLSYQVAWDPNDTTNAVASIRTVTQVNGVAQTVYQTMYSTDAGNTWSNSTGIPNTDRIEFAYAPSVTDRIYATGSAGGVYRSADGGQSWSLRGTIIGSGNQWWYNNCIWVDPTNSNRIVVGEVSVWRSTDGAATWTECGDNGSTSPHSDVHRIIAHPNYNGSSNRQVMVATDGGIYRTLNIDTASNTAGATGWTDRNQDLRVAQFYEADSSANLLLAGGLQDNGTVSVQGNSSLTSTKYIGGDGFPAYISSTNPNLIYGAYQFCHPHRSTDGGLTGNSIRSGIASTEFGKQATRDLTPPFRTPLMLAESDPNYLYMGSFSVWRCSNAGATTPTWTAIRAQLPLPATGSWKASAIAVSPTNPDVVWIAYWNAQTATARLSVSFNATSASSTWTDLSMTNFPANRFITRLASDQSNPLSCLVCFGGFNPNGLWRTTFFLTQTDENLSGAGLTAIPSAPVYSVTQHPTIPDRLYAATEVGVFSSTDDGQTWASENDGPLDVACYDIRFANNSETLVLATHGRGIWTSEVVDPQVNPYGVGCPGTFGTPELSATPPSFGEDCVITTTNCYPGGSVWLVQGYSNTGWLGLTLPLPLTAFGAPGCNLLVRPDLVRDGFADAAGVATTLVPIPALPALVGQQIYLQSWAADLVNSFGRVGSQALELVVGY